MLVIAAQNDTPITTNEWNK